jgi:N-acetylmuramoyl-L-alanine amidase
MWDWKQPLLRSRMGRLRVCLLLALGITCVWLLAGSGIQQEARQAGAPAAKPLEGLTVALDPGHGGYDGGARAHDSGVWEKVTTLQIALAVEKELIARGAQVVLTRREDLCLAGEETTGKARKRQDLKARTDLAQAAGADVFLSIHLNEYRSRRESGPQVFYQRGGEAGRLLAGVLQAALIRGLEPKKERAAMAGDYYVLRSPIPSALVECGFLSNPEEEKLLLDAAYHERIAAALADGLQEYRLLLRQQQGAQ